MKKRIIWFRILFGIMACGCLLEGGKYFYYREAIDGQLKTAQEAQSIDMMKNALYALKSNLENRGFTSGYTSFIYQLLGANGANIADFYSNVQNHIAELEGLQQEKKMEKTFEGVKSEIKEMQPPLAFYYLTQFAPWFFILFVLTYLWLGISIVGYAGWDYGFIKILFIDLKKIS